MPTRIEIRKRDDVPRRPVVGKRDTFKGAFLVVEISAGKCHRVHGGHDDYGTAARIAHDVANRSDAHLADGIDVNYNRLTPRGYTYYQRTPLVPVRDRTVKAPRTYQGKKKTSRRAVNPATLVVATKHGEAVASDQRFHARDIKRNRVCQACDGTDPAALCAPARAQDKHEKAREEFRTLEHNTLSALRDAMHTA